MKLKQAVTPTITIGDQPTETDLNDLRNEGYLGVINLRNDGEPEQPLGTGPEGDLVRKLGLDYYHCGVGSGPLSELGVLEVCKFLDEHGSGKTLVHCRKGGRAAALVLLYFARKRGWKPAEAIAKGAAMGLTVEGGLKNIVEAYLESHSGEHCA
jgi:uncharacterized protein (TIGR01244 family)